MCPRAALKPEPENCNGQTPEETARSKPDQLQTATFTIEVVPVGAGEGQTHLQSKLGRDGATTGINAPEGMAASGGEGGQSRKPADAQKNGACGQPRTTA